MNFSKRLYKVQTIVFGIMMALFYALALVSIISGIISLINTNNSESAEGIGNAFLFVFSIIGAIAGAALGVVMMIKFISTLKLNKSLKNSPQEFMLKKPSRVVNLVFTILIIIAAVVAILINQELILIIASIVIALIVLIFEILDGVALRKIKSENIE